MPPLSRLTRGCCDGSIYIYPHRDGLYTQDRQKVCQGRLRGHLQSNRYPDIYIYIYMHTYSVVNPLFILWSATRTRNALFPAEAPDSDIFPSKFHRQLSTIIHGFIPVYLYYGITPLHLKSTSNTFIHRAYILLIVVASTQFIVPSRKSSTRVGGGR